MDNNAAHSGRSIRVLVVEDSPVLREFLIYLFASDQELQVVGAATNGEEALQAVQLHRPDVITMDLHMPKMDGYAATRAIMESMPTPIVIVTGSSSSEETATTMKALEAGALAVLKRPQGIGHADHTATARELIQAVKLMSEVKVVRRWPVFSKKAEPGKKDFPRNEIKLVAIGASTGGPQALERILAELPRNFPAPIVIVQHMTEGFTEGFCQWLGETSGYQVQMAADGELVEAGQAYVAPYGRQMAMDGEGRLRLSRGAPENGHQPSVSWLFRSVAKAYGARAAGVLLTGMGRDGAAELGEMKRRGAVTLVQDKESSVVHGMPGEALALEAATYELAPEEIAAALISMTR